MIVYYTSVYSFIIKIFPNQNHEQSAVYVEFSKDVSELIGIVHGMCNPFCDDGKYIVTLDTKQGMDSSIIQTLQTVETIRKTQ